jgi:hypothetical protein
MILEKINCEEDELEERIGPVAAASAGGEIGAIAIPCREYISVFNYKSEINGKRRIRGVI